MRRILYDFSNTITVSFGLFNYKQEKLVLIKFAKKSALFGKVRRGPLSEASLVSRVLGMRRTMEA